MASEYTRESQRDQEFGRKMRTALSLLEKTRISRRNYLPPTSAFFWRMKLRIPPPHFMSFFNVSLLMGLPFGVIWIGFCMASTGSRQEIDVPLAVLVFVIITLFVGSLFAAYYQSGRSRYRLPRWDEL